MSKRSFNAGDVVRIRENPVRVTKQVKALVGRIGVVTGKLPSSPGADVAYGVKIDNKIYRVTNAYNLIGPLPKEALTNPSYQIPKTTRPSPFYYSKEGVVKVVTETNDIVITDDNKSIPKERFERYYIEIPQQYVKYIQTTRWGSWDMSAIKGLMLADDTKNLASVLKILNLVIGNECITASGFKQHVIAQDSINCGNYAFLFDSYELIDMSIKEKFRQRICQIVFEFKKPAFVRFVKSDFEEDILFRDQQFATKLTNTVNKMVGYDKYSEQDILENLKNIKIDDLLMNFQVVFSGNNNVISIILNELGHYWSFTRVAVVSYNSNFDIKYRIRNKKMLQQLRSTYEHMNGLEGLFDL